MKTKAINLIGVTLLFPTIIFSAPSAGNAKLQWVFENIILLLGLMVIIAVFFSLWNLANSIMNQKISELRGEASLEKIVKGPSIFKKLYDKSWNLIPMDKEADFDLGHDYDGIRELDNSLPPWWTYTFYITIIWSMGYIYVFHMSDLGESQSTEYAIEMEDARVAMRNLLASKGDDINEGNVKFLGSAEALEIGKTRFNLSCAVCHNTDGRGGVGPNLTDEYWINGGSIQDIFKTIKYGVPQKGMIAWESQIQPSTMQKVASYILTMQGTNPPEPKAPQGDLYVREEVNQMTEAIEEEQ